MQVLPQWKDFSASAQVLRPLQLQTGCVELFTVTVVLSAPAPWHTLLNCSYTLMMLCWLMKDCMGQRFCNAVVWSAELVRVKKKLEIS